MSCPDIKYCRRCGEPISDLNDPSTDLMSHISIKYCPECAKEVAKMQRKNWASKSRDAKKTVDNYLAEYCSIMRERIDMLKEQNELLRGQNDLLKKQIISLREKYEL